MTGARGWNFISGAAGCSEAIFIGRLRFTPAPNLQAVAVKIRAIWSDNLTMMSTDPFVVAQQMMIDEVERLAQVAA